MSEELAPAQPVLRRRACWWKWLAVVTCLPLVVFGLSNLWLATPPGRGWVAGRLGRLTGLEARTGPLSWSPWNGVTARQVELLAPEPLRAGGEPLLSVKRVTISVHWRSLAKGVLVARSIEVEEPRLRLPVELLSVLATRQPVVVVQVPQNLAAAPPNAAPGTGAGEGTVGQATGPEVAVAAPAQTPGAMVPPGTDLGGTAWMKVSGASLWLGPAGQPQGWIEAEGVDAEVPMAGNEAPGRVAVASLRLGNMPAKPTEVALHWRAPVLTMGPWTPPLEGVHCEVRAQAIPAGPLPFLVECQLPKQEIARRDWAGGWSVGAAVGEALFRAGGYFRSPSSWQGECQATAAGLAVGQQGGLQTWFDDARLALGVRNGMIMMSDARAIGEAGSLLANGWLFADGRVAAVGRLVLPRDSALALQERFGAAFLTAEGGGFGPLETPDRWAMDTRLGGTVGEPWVEFGNGPTRSLKRVLEEVRGR